MSTEKKNITADELLEAMRDVVSLAPGMDKYGATIVGTFNDEDKKTWKVFKDIDEVIEHDKMVLDGVFTGAEIRLYVENKPATEESAARVKKLAAMCAEMHSELVDRTQASEKNKWDWLSKRFGLDTSKYHYRLYTTEDPPYISNVGEIEAHRSIREVTEYLTEVAKLLGRF